MSFKIIVTQNAAADMKAIHEYVAAHDAPDKAEYLVKKIVEVIGQLSESPNRGNCPRELSTLGIREFREVFFKPYRIVYQIRGKAVYIMLVADGRRNMQMLLQRRLLET